MTDAHFLARAALALPLLLAAACAQEEETPVVETEVAPTSEADAETIGPIDRSLADEAENSPTAPAGEVDGAMEGAMPEDID